MIIVSEVFAWVWPAGRLNQARGSVTLASDTTKTETLAVPAGKIWLVLAIMMHNGDDVSRTMYADIVDASGNKLHNLGERSSTPAGSYVEILGYVPTAGTYHGGFGAKPVLVKGGNKINLVWSAGGASSGGTAYYCVTYLEVEA